MQTLKSSLTNHHRRRHTQKTNNTFSQNGIKTSDNHNPTNLEGVRREKQLIRILSCQKGGERQFFKPYFSFLSFANSGKKRSETQRDADCRQNLEAISRNWE